MLSRFRDGLTQLVSGDSGTANEPAGHSSDGLPLSQPVSARDRAHLYIVASHATTCLMQTQPEDPDADLMARVGRGDEAAFRVLILRKIARIHALAARLLDDRALADDVAQDAFIRIWRTARHWREGEARFDTWLHRVVLNLCTDRLRRRRVTFVPDPPEQVDHALTADRQMLRDEMAARVRQAVDRLPTRQKEAIVLQTYQDLSNIDTAAAMGISIEALESLLSRARRSLRSTLGEEEP
jgi:RNA polymerase sigma-70 factor (ECF subfamily)